MNEVMKFNRGLGELTVGAGVARGVIEVAVSRGADREELGLLAGVDPASLADQDNRISVAAYQALIHAGQKLAGDPALALHYGEEVNLWDVSIVGLVGYAAEDLAETFEQLNRYCALIVEADTAGRPRFSLVEDERGTWIVDNRLEPNRFSELTEVTFSRMITGTRRVTSTRFVKEVHVTHSDPGYRSEYERIFGAPVHFRSDRNAILGEGNWPRLKVANAPVYAFGMFSERARALLEQLERSRTARGRVESVLMPILHTGDISLERIAAKLGWSRATLYRRLKAEGLTYEAIVDDLRRRLALHYLTGDKVSILDIAYMVGFSDPTAFSRAFKRWTGRSPRAYRQEQISRL